MSLPEPDATGTPISFPHKTDGKDIRNSDSVQTPESIYESTPPLPPKSSATQELESNRYSDGDDCSNSDESTPRLVPKSSGSQESESNQYSDGDDFPNSNKSTPPLPARSSASQESESNRYSDGDGSSNSDESTPRLVPKSSGSQESEYDHYSKGDDSSNGDHSRRGLQQSQNNGSKVPIVLSFLLALVIAATIAGYYGTSELDIQEEFMSLEKEFSNQDLDFWRTIKVGIQEIPVLDQPRTIMFLYNNKAEKTLNKILNRVSEIGVCHLRKCSDKPVIIEGASLNTTKIVNDYGKIISKYRNVVEKNGVMVIKNLEKVPGKSAQAFHSYCDDYNPVVKHALILFTVKVENLPQGYIGKFIEDFLLKLWNDIGRDDKFYPLFTRITGTVLSVRPE